MFCNYKFFRNLNVFSDGSLVLINKNLNYLKKFDKVIFFEKDFKSFQDQFKNKSLLYSNKFSNHTNIQYRQKFFMN